MLDMARFYLVVGSFLAVVNSVLCISCYQCKSNEDIYCAEKFDTKYSTLEAVGCEDIFEARFCVKTTGMYGGEIGTRRFCSARDHGNYCEYIRRPGDEWEYRSCVYTCYSDGCNTASFQSPRLSTVLGAAALLTSVTYFWTRS